MLKRTLKHIRDGLISLSYPEECSVCGCAIEDWDDGVACAICWSDTSVTRIFSGVNACPCCGIPTLFHSAKRLLPRDETSSSLRDRPTRCRECENRPYTLARAGGEYSGAIEASILFLKTRPFISPRLRSVITSALTRDEAILAGAVVLPVPLHRKRKRERGFNQARMVADIAAKNLDMVVRQDVLVRVKYTERHRAGMDASDRARSVEKAFKVVKPDAVRGRTVLVVDDLYTTGSTVSAVTRELLAAGADRVNVFTIARVPPPGRPRGPYTLPMATDSGRPEADNIL